MIRKDKKGILATLLCSLCLAFLPAQTSAGQAAATEAPAPAEGIQIGGGFAVTGQLADAGYTAELYDATNGLPTSDANAVLAASDGYIWIGGYSGVIRYDGSTFERQDASGGLTSGRSLFEDSQGRIWVGTNDNGVVLLDDGNSWRYTYRDGLPSSSIRSFAEDAEGTVYIGTTNGIAYVDHSGQLRLLEDERLTNRTIVRMDADTEGSIYGCTYEGDIFSIKDGALAQYYHGDELGTGSITALCADPDTPGMVYLGTETDVIYHGTFGSSASQLQQISVSPVEYVYWLSAACGRIWVTSESVAGYLDEHQTFHAMEHLPMNHSIDMMTADYQGNLWFASSRQGVMKVVTNNFQNISEMAGLAADTVNATCLRQDLLYIGTDSGLRILDNSQQVVENELTTYLEGTRIRCLAGQSVDLYL